MKTFKSLPSYRRACYYWDQNIQNRLEQELQPMKQPAPPQESLRIYDNFLKPEHLELVRSSVSMTGFGTWTPAAKGVLKRGSFQGCGYVGRHDLVFMALCAYLGRQVYPQETKFRRTGEGESDKSHIHGDNAMGTHTAVLYLTPEASETSGTGFYKYRPNPKYEVLEDGLNACPAYSDMILPNQTVGEHEKVKLRPWAEELRADMEDEDPENTTKWKRTAFVNEEPNRCIIFPAALFHCRLPTGGLGTNDKTMRLIWACHFRT